jgi:Methyltransferase domain
LNRIWRRAARLRIPVDTWERHAIVARLLGEPETLLDIGGRPGELQSFLLSTRVFAANVDRPADVLFDGHELPFHDQAFEAVTSLDVLEHVPPADRIRHVEELTRITAERVVLCTPLGSPEHVEAERALDRWYREQTGRRHPFLQEHLEHGLPREEELLELVDGLGFQFELLFHGDLRDLDRVFRKQVLARRGRPSALASYVYERLAARPRLELSPESSPWTNRVFVSGVRHPAKPHKGGGLKGEP